MSIVKAIRVFDIDGENGQKPGAFEYIVNYEANVCGFDFRCPCGCGTLGYLPFTNSADRELGPHWTFNGDPDSPTLTPSVQQTGECKWHGYLVAGEWKEC